MPSTQGAKTASGLTKDAKNAKEERDKYLVQVYRDLVLLPYGKPLACGNASRTRLQNFE
ncbi:hypothetical protein I8748_06930 [Nostoc sp. CENA67]|uniref:Uncharacterized protein n=1 Tax=Amazonocrinis nigriterrae CENA67 TaxID=2794033 RepID=A0A8J7L788_9NOST|nr:hypothetical protein [Amazonocrinis nigriterrae]MBH8561910.1 hypothetical protein [Amazonocrinis nigriterrae CENA67]